MKIKSSHHHITDSGHSSTSRGSSADGATKGRSSHSAGSKHTSDAARQEHNLSIGHGTGGKAKTDRADGTKTGDGTDSAPRSAKGLIGRIRDRIGGITGKPPLPGPVGSLPSPHDIIPRPSEIIDRVGGAIGNVGVPAPGLSAGDFRKIRGSLDILGRRIDQVKQEIERAKETRGKVPVILVERLRRLEEKSEQLSSTLKDRSSKSAPLQPAS
jgi:hypothetical protein